LSISLWELVKNADSKFKQATWNKQQPNSCD